MSPEGERAGTAGVGRRPIGAGVEMPVLGLGVWQIPDGPEAVRVVRSALEAGYRHIDTAQAYGNEASVGRGLRESGVPREEVFITTKFEPRAGREPAIEAERSRDRLGVDQVDLYLVHSPTRGPMWAWPGMERALEQGLTRAIGVSNFDLREVEKVVRSASVPPAVDQVQFSPFHYRRRLLDGCRRLGVEVEAYSPLTSGQDLADPVVAEVAIANHRTPAQVLLRWALQRGLIVIPKTTHVERMNENLDVFDFLLSEADLARLDALDRTGGTAVAFEQKWWTRRARARSIAGRLVKRIRR